jgi:hypothetical protein
MRNNSIPQQHDRFALVRDRELSDLIDGLEWVFDSLNRGDAFHRGRLSDERVATLAVISAAIAYLIGLREGRV